MSTHATIDTNVGQPATHPGGPDTHYQDGHTNTTDTVDAVYLRSIGGILKAVELVFSLITFICASISSEFYHHGKPWVQFVSMTTFLLTAILYVFHVFKLPPRFPKSIPFKFCEFFYYAFFTLCYFICGIVCSVFGHIDGSVGAAAFFSFATMLLYGADIYFCYIEWRHSGEGPCVSRPSESYPNTSSTAADMQY